MIYAGFWRRLGAFLLDNVILLPIYGVFFWGNTHYRLFYLYAILPNFIFSLYYQIYLVRRLGGTPGKWLAGLKICKPDGSNMGYREATLRCLPELLMSSVLSIGYCYAALSMTDSEYGSLSIRDRNSQLIVLTPSWYGPLEVILQIWIWGEFLVMMTNRKRRALHDFIAGTVVIRRGVSVPVNKAASELLENAG